MFFFGGGGGHIRGSNIYKHYSSWHDGKKLKKEQFLKTCKRCRYIFQIETGEPVSSPKSAS